MSLGPQSSSYQRISRFLLGGLWPGRQLPALAVISSGKMPGFVPCISPHSSVAIFVTAVFRSLLPVIEKEQVALSTFSPGKWPVVFTCSSPGPEFIITEAAW